MCLFVLTVISLVIAAALLVLPWRPWSTRESLDADPSLAGADVSDVTVLIPARNEAGVIASTLRSLEHQGEGAAIIVIDDHSIDGTAQIVQSLNIGGGRVITAPALPPGWSGKLWALEQGRQLVTTPLTLLLDADITLLPDTIPTLRRKLMDEHRQLVSLMAHLGMESWIEKWLLPAFVYFFKLIYPFKLANTPGARVAAAAGGCILVRTDALRQIGGFAAIRGAIIDDCTLADAVKRQVGAIWLGLTHSAISQRRYSFADLWHMVARTAYTQLHYSPLLLAACFILMTLYYLVPVVAFASSPALATMGLAAFGMYCIAYVPVLSYYRLSPMWAALLPVTAALYLAMTAHSALRYYRGERSRWKGRVYQSSD